MTKFLTPELQRNFLVALNSYIMKANSSEWYRVKKSPIFGVELKDDGEFVMLIDMENYGYVTRKQNGIVDYANKNTNCHINLIGNHEWVMQLEEEGVNPAPYRKSWEHVKIGTHDWIVELIIKMPSEIAMVNMMNNLIEDNSTEQWQQPAVSSRLKEGLKKMGWSDDEAQAGIKCNGQNTAHPQEIPTMITYEEMVVVVDNQPFFKIAKSLAQNVGIAGVAAKELRSIVINNAELLYMVMRYGGFTAGVSNEEMNLIEK